MSKINSKSTKAELEAYIAELEAKLQSQSSQPAVETVKEPVIIEKKNKDYVTLVYCSDSMGYAKVSNMEFNFTQYGEKYRVPIYVFDELVGKYRSWFNEGIFAVSADDLDIAVEKGIPTVDDFALSAQELNKLGNMSVDEIKALWEKTNKLEHRKSMASFVKRKFIEGDMKYRNREKIDLFNRLTDGGFKREQKELDGDYKIEPTDMLK